MRPRRRPQPMPPPNKSDSAEPLSAGYDSISQPPAGLPRSFAWVLIVLVALSAGFYFGSPDVVREARATMRDWWHRNPSGLPGSVPTPEDIRRLRHQPDMPPIAQYHLREFLGAWKLHSRFPGVWDKLVTNWASATGSEVSAYEREAREWEAEWDGARLQAGEELELAIRPVPGQGLDLDVAPHLRTADFGEVIHLQIQHAPGSVVTEDPVLFWTTQSLPDPDARRRKRGTLTTDPSGTSSTLTFDLSGEPSWVQVGARPLRLAVRMRLSQDWSMKGLRAE